MTWPAVPVVAMAYVDQLERAEVLQRPLARDLNRALGRSESQIDRARTDSDLAADLEALVMQINSASNDATTNRRLLALSETIDVIADRLR